jgi:hypothetical protein
MDKRYQIFVSSTYADLQQERQKVIQAVMEMDCIPAGMELFPAADEEQWEFIKRIIDDCDYYVLIIGGRYGSLTPEGVSYTEKEYDYAQSIGLDVLAFVHEAPDDIPVGKSDIDPVLRAKLEAFRERVSENRLVKFWKTAAELPGLVALSLSKTIKVHPAVGWVRASNVSNDELLQDLNTLRKENQTLRATIGSLQEAVGPRPQDNLAGLDESFEATIEYSVYDQYSRRSHTKHEAFSTTWADLFARIAPDLLENPNDALVSSRLGKSIYKSLHSGGEKAAHVEHDCFQTIKLQLTAQSLVNVAYSKTVKGGMALFWSLTARGQRVMLQLRTVKTASNN